LFDKHVLTSGVLIFFGPILHLNDSQWEPLSHGSIIPGKQLPPTLFLNSQVEYDKEYPVTNVRSQYSSLEHLALSPKQNVILKKFLVKKKEKYSKK
jgi:hypothetical protein